MLDGGTLSFLHGAKSHAILLLLLLYIMYTINKVRAAHLIVKDLGHVRTVTTKHAGHLEHRRSAPFVRIFVVRTDMGIQLPGIAS